MERKILNYLLAELQLRRGQKNHNDHDYELPMNCFYYLQICKKYQEPKRTKRTKPKKYEIIYNVELVMIMKVVVISHVEKLRCVFE